MRKVLLLIDYQKGFKSDCSKATIPVIERLAKRGGWDDIIQTMWLNSKEPDSPYIQNLGYTEDTLSSLSSKTPRYLQGTHASKMDWLL